MNKDNFNTIDKIKTPDEWKAKALNIPCTQIKKVDTKHCNFYRLATTFCLIIVCIVSVILFTNIDNLLKPDTVIRNKPVNTEATEFESQERESSHNTQKEHETTPHNENNTVSHDSTIEPSEKEDSTDSTTGKPEKPTNSSTSTPTVAETSAHTIPTEKVTTIPTETPTQKPTDKPENVVFNGSVKVEGMWVTNIDVYCKILDSNGNLLGSADLFDEQHEAEYVGEINNVEYYRYCASEKGLTFTHGYYTYVFYRPNGSVVCSGTQYVS